MQKQLIKDCQKNKREAQSQLFYLYKDVLFGLCLKYCKNREEAEDNLQESFISIFKNIKQYKFKGSFEGWIKRITIRKAIDRYNKKILQTIPIKEEILEETNGEVTMDSNLNEFSLHQLLSFIRQLPTQYQMVFTLYELDDFSHKEISEFLNISVGTSKSNLYRAKHLLREIISETKNTTDQRISLNG